MNESELIDQIYGTVADRGRWSEVIVRISDYLGAAGGLLTYIGPEGRTLEVLGRLSDELIGVYRQHYVRNPWSLAMKDCPDGKAVILNSLFEPGTLFKSGFYADVLAPQRLQNGLGMKLKALAVDGGIGGFNFCLSARGPEHAEHALPRLQRLIPHLSRALDGTMEIGRIAGGPQKLAAILNVMPGPALLLDRRGRIVHANPAADSLFNADDGLSLHRNGRPQLAATLPAESGALARAIASALNVAVGTGIELSEPVRITRPSGADSLLIIPVPLPQPAFALWELSDTARVLVLIVDPSSQPGSAASILRKTFGLTAAEARVAVLVGQGLSGPQAATALGVSLDTVKTHLARCFDKTGVHSQVMLARLISALPGGLPEKRGWS